MNRIPFSERELEPKGYINRPFSDPVPLYSTPVSLRDNYMAALKGEDPLWMPLSCDCKMFVPGVLPDNPPHGVLLEARRPNLEGFTGGKGMFEIDWFFDPKAGGSMVKPGDPLIREAAELDTKLVWPDPSQWDWEGSAELNRDYLSTDFLKATLIFCGFFERLIALMDFENAAVAMIDEEDQPYVHRFFDRLCGLYEDMFVRIKQHFDIDLIIFQDDWGSQRAPMLSEDTVREMILPYLKRLVDCAHANGMLFEMHSCGHIGSLTPIMIEAGADAWAPQSNANDTWEIYEKYGDRISIGMAPPLPPDAPESDFVEWARQFVEDCVGRPGMRTPYLSEKGTPVCLRETVYRLSRKKLCGTAE